MASSTLLTPTCRSGRDTPTSCPAPHEETAQFGIVIIGSLLLFVRQKQRGCSCLRAATTNKSRMFEEAFSSLSTVMLLQTLL